MKYLFLSMLSLLQISSANAQFNNYNDFTYFVKEAIKVCDFSESGKCGDSGFSTQVVSLHDYPKSFQADFKDAARSIANVWGDTILEGDYGVAGSAYAQNQVTEIYFGSDLMGYNFTAAQHGWYTGDCEINESSNNPYVIYKNCTQGTITEEGFASLNFEFVTNNPDDYAEFND